MAITTTPLDISRNATASAIATQLDTLLAGAGGISLIDIDVQMRETNNDTIPRITVTYKDPGAAEYRARYFTSDAAINAFFAANPLYRGIQILDISPRQRRKITRNDLIIIYTESLDSACPGAIGNLSHMRIVVATENIAAGATGLVAIDSQAGPQPVIFSLVNTFDFLWPIGQQGWAVLDPATCSWIGYPSCCP